MILIGGISRGLGHALAENFLVRQHTVVGCCRDGTRANEVNQRLGTSCHVSAVDVADDAAVAVWAKSVLGQFGPPQLLVNNAAVINENANLWDVPAEEFSQLVDINIKGSFHVIRHFLPAMIERGSGVVVNFSSTWGRTTSPQVAPYCTSKWAIEGMTRALAQELPKGLAAVALNPGVIHTDMLETCFGDSAASYPSPVDWAKRAAPFLLKLGPKDNGQSVTAP